MKKLQWLLLSCFGFALLTIPGSLSAQDSGGTRVKNKMVGKKFKEFCRRELRATFGRGSPVGGERGGSSG